MGHLLIEKVLKRDRLIILASLLIITALAWSYLAILAVSMTDMISSNSTDMMKIKPWSGIDFILMFLMWAVMMVAMMIPSAAPMILLFSMFNRKMREQGHQFVSTYIFIAGYIFVWSVFSLVATLLQWQLEQAALLSSMMVSSSPILGGVILILGGVYQWTPIKRTCVKHCRSPVQFISSNWRKGIFGAFIMGLEHGVFCLGCCWVLMALLFVGGVMNLMWIATISIFVLVEKVVPSGDVIGRLSGFLLVATGIFLITQAVS